MLVHRRVYHIFSHNQMVFSQLAGDSESLAKGLPVERFLGKPSSVLAMTGAKKFANAPRKQQGREVANFQNGGPL